MPTPPSDCSMIHWAFWFGTEKNGGENRQAAKPSTRRSVRTSMKMGLLGVLIKAVRKRLSITATKPPHTVPTRASSALLEGIYPTRRVREAPSARRTVISRSRLLARASIKLARLAQAINRTSPKVPAGSVVVHTTPPVYESNEVSEVRASTLRWRGGESYLI